MPHHNHKILHRRCHILLAGLLIVLTGMPIMALVVEASAAEPVLADFRQKLIRGHWSEDPQIMRKEHGKVLINEMNKAAQATSRKEDDTIERCVTCHVKRDEKQAPVSASDPRHYCTQCHAKSSVSINCFTCHASLPASDAATMDKSVRNAEAIDAHLQQWKKYEQEKAAKGAAK
jgi:hypothetical protein